MNDSFDIDAMVRGYLGCLLWSETDDDGNPLDSLYSVDDIAPDALTQAREDCADFVGLCTREGINLQNIRGMEAGSIGHDFLLSRNRHGAGFWDRGLGKLGDTLHALTEPYGTCNAYIGDDGLIYFHG